MSFLSRWDRYTCTEAEFARCREALVRHNLMGLSIASPLVACVVVLLSFYPREAGGPNCRPMYYAAAFVNIIIFLVSRRMLHKAVSGSEKTGGASLARRALGIEIFFYILLLFFCCFVYLVDSGSHIAIRFLLFFMVLQVFFVITAKANLLINLLVVALFTIGKVVFQEKKPWLDFDTVNICAAAVVSMTLAWYVAYAVIRQLLLKQRLETDRDRLQEESVHDQLTGLHNRRGFEQTVNFYTSVCAHVHQTVCVIMMDVDFFKDYNDFYGHLKGDEVLKAAGHVLRVLSEEEKLFTARVGGEEFIAIWTENRVSEAERVALKLREMIHALKIPHYASQVSAIVTASLGLYILRGGTVNTYQQLYENVDTALYAAKESGRDRIMLLDSATMEIREVELRPSAAARRAA